MRSGIHTGFVVPIRSFALGKARLAPALDDGARAALVQRMADAVVDAAGTHPLLVVTSAPEVLAWCEARGLATVDEPGSLNAAADAGRAWARSLGYARVGIVHADLPNATTLETLVAPAAEPVAVLVPDRHDDGTPALSVPVDAPFVFAYGPGSFGRHLDAARDAGLEVRVARDPGLTFDVDVAADLVELVDVADLGATPPCR
jgi:2-phospho-L-lactate guanylyltransferase